MSRLSRINPNPAAAAVSPGAALRIFKGAPPSSVDWYALPGNTGHVLLSCLPPEKTRRSTPKTARHDRH